MKKNNILFGLISLLCASSAAGCSSGGGGVPTYEIKATTVNHEDGIVIGGGKYKNGETVELKFYPVEGCENPTVDFYPEGETTAKAHYTTGNEEGNIKLSADGKYYTLSIVVNDGVADATKKNFGTYKTGFTCYKNYVDKLSEKEIAKYSVNFKLVDASGNDLAVTLESQIKKYNEKVKEIRYVDGVEGIVKWYVANYAEDTKQWTKTETVYDFSSPVRDNLYLIGVIESTTAEEIVKDAITNLNKSNKLVITSGEGKSATVLGLNQGLSKVYFSDGNSIISNNTYYEIKSSYQTLYYKMPLGADKSGFELKDIKNVYDYLDASLLVFSEEDAYEVTSNGGSENVVVLSIKGSYSNNQLTMGDLTYTIDETKKAVTSNGKVVGSYVNNTLTLGEFSYTLGEEGKVTNAGGDKVGSYADNTVTLTGVEGSPFTIDSTKVIVKNSKGAVVGAYTSANKKVEFNDVEKNVANKSYIIDGDNVKQIVETVDCKIYTVTKDSKKYMDLYINKGYIYKTVRYDEAGVKDRENVFEYSTDTFGKTSLDKNVHDMNFIKFYTTGYTPTAEEHSPLDNELIKINESFEDVLRNVAIELKSLDTLIKENSKLNDLLKKYDYTVCMTNGCTSDKLINVDQTLPVSSTEVVRTLYIKVNASYDTVATAINALKTGGFTISTQTKVFGEDITRTYNMKAGSDVLNIDMTSLPKGMNRIIAETLVKLNNLDNYARFEYLQEDKGEETEKNIYKFYANESDSVPYITIELDKENKLSKVTYYDLSNANVNERNTYISTFTPYTPAE